MREPIDRPRGSIAAMVADQAQRRPDAVGLTFLRRGQVVGTPATYAALDIEARRVAAVLEDRGLVGERVLLAFPAGPAFVGAFLGCLYAGAIAIPVPATSRSTGGARLAAIARQATAAAVLVPAGADAADASDARTIALDADGPDGSLARCAGLSMPDGRDIVHQYTSGSTQQPRGVRWDDRCVAENARLLGRSWRLRERPVVVSWLPHHHDMGLLGGLLIPLLFGAPVVHFAPLEFVQKPVRWLRAISDHGGQASGGPAFAFELCTRTVSDEDVATLSLASWDRAFCGAEAVRRETLARFEARLRGTGLRPGSTFACYGLAESTLFVAGDPNPLGAGPEAALPETTLPEVERMPCRLNDETDAAIRIVDPRSRRVVDGDGGEGEIWVSSTSVARGYDGDPRSDAVFSACLVPDDGRRYLRTGDLGRRRGGFLVVTGRIKDVLLVNGVNVPASDVEWIAARQHPALNGHAAAAVHVDAMEQGDAALVIELVDRAPPHLDEAALIAAIRAAVLSELGVVLRDVRLVPRGSLPRTTSGKIQRHLVRHAIQSAADR